MNLKVTLTITSLLTNGVRPGSVSHRRTSRPNSDQRGSGRRRFPAQARRFVAAPFLQFEEVACERSWPC
jgi:hypothetical protein